MTPQEKKTTPEQPKPKNQLIINAPNDTKDGPATILQYFLSKTINSSL